MQRNILEYLEDTVQKYPQKTAFANDKMGMTFQEVYQVSRSIGSCLCERGYEREPVVIYMQKHPHMIAAFWGVVYSGCFYVPIDEEMPKFRIETSTRLNRALSAMGAKRVFTGAAELGGISDANIAVDEVKQKCYVEVNEEGSEAAAVTSIGIRLTSANVGPKPVSMTVDRPFLFMIADMENDNILFMGRIMNLEK